MKMRFRNDISYVTVDFPVSIFVYQRFGYFHLEVSGLDSKETIHKWIDEKIEVGEYIEFEVVDIEEHLSTEAAQKEAAFVDVPLGEDGLKEMYAQQLAKFYALQAYLLREGLIEQSING
ncbi:hypothetical protein [Sphingobacterium griseoflavum]|nr:hypothetical protein [Sphingobacterium griseoflavum]